MSWNGAGVFNRIYSWVADKNAGIDITASRMDTDTDDITSNGFGNTLTRDGQGSATANLPMNGFRHTGVGNGVAATDYAAMGQLQGGGINWGVATGTSDAIAVSYAPALVTLVDGQLCFFRAGAANATATPTFSPNGLTPEVITKDGGIALALGDVPGNLAECCVRYNLVHTRWELLNPQSQVTGYGGETATVTITIATPGVVTWTAHGLPANALVEFSTTGALPTGLSAATPYYVVQSSITTNTFEVSAAPGGAPINTTGTQSGTQTGTSQTVAGNLAAFSSSSGTILKDGGPALFGAPNLLASALAMGAVMINGTLVQSQASSAQTFATKTLAGNDPSVQDPVYFLFRDVTIAAGDYKVRTVTAALNITIPSTKGMGFVNATPGRVWIGALDNAGTVELFVINCLLAGPGTYPLQGWSIISTSAVSGATAAGVAYSTTSRTSLAYLTLGYATWEAGGTLGTAGTWNVAPTRMQLFQPGAVPLPGMVVQARSATTTTNGTTSSATYATLTNTPSIAITPSSSANPVRVSAQGSIGSSGASAVLFLQMLRGSTAIGIETGINSNATLTAIPLPLSCVDLPGSITSVTYQFQGKSSSGTLNFPAATYGVLLEVQEIMA